MKAIPKRTLLVTCIIILLPMFFGLALWNQPARAHAHPFQFQRRRWTAIPAARSR